MGFPHADFVHPQLAGCRVLMRFDVLLSTVALESLAVLLSTVTLGRLAVLCRVRARGVLRVMVNAQKRLGFRVFEKLDSTRIETKGRSSSKSRRHKYRKA